MKNELTILIPTYNRKIDLTKTLSMLQKQFCNDFYVVISDNNSDYSIENDILSNLDDLFVKNIFVYHRKQNIGMNGNLAGLLELSKTKWAWTMGDDDKLCDNAVNKVKEYIEKNSDSGGVWFSISNGNFQSKKIYTLMELVEIQKKIRNFGDFIFLSNKIYNIEYTRKYNENIYLFQGSGIAQCYPIYDMLKDGIAFDVVFGEKIVVHGGFPNGMTYDFSKLATGTKCIIDYPSNLSRKNQRVFLRYNMFSYKEVISIYLRNEIPWNYRTYLRNMYYSFYRYALAGKDKCLAYVMFNVLSFPLMKKIGYCLYKIIRGVRK